MSSVVEPVANEVKVEPELVPEEAVVVDEPVVKFSTYYPKNKDGKPFNIYVGDCSEHVNIMFEFAVPGQEHMKLRSHYARIVDNSRPLENSRCVRTEECDFLRKLAGQSGYYSWSEQTLSLHSDRSDRLYAYNAGFADKCDIYDHGGFQLMWGETQMFANIWLGSPELGDQTEGDSITGIPLPGSRKDWFLASKSLCEWLLGRLSGPHMTPKESVAETCDYLRKTLDLVKDVTFDEHDRPVRAEAVAV